MDKKLIVVALVVLVIGGGGGFLGGVKYQESKTSSNPNQSLGSQSGPRQFPGGDLSEEEREKMREQFMSGNPPEGFSPPDGSGFRGSISGEVIDHDEESITIKLEDGSSRIVFIGSETQINKYDPVTKDDLKEKIQVTILGSENDDGSIDARAVQIIEDSER